jgi:hypothetical protein
MKTAADLAQVRVLRQAVNESSEPVQQNSVWRGSSALMSNNSRT